MKSIDTYKDIEILFDRLFPICRSITGEGFKESIEIISEHIPLEVEEIASGTKVFDWEVPLEFDDSSRRHHISGVYRTIRPDPTATLHRTYSIGSQSSLNLMVSLFVGVSQGVLWGKPWAACGATIVIA